MLSSMLARLAMLFSLPMTAFAVGAVLLGEAQPVHPALRGFIEGCADTSQPCWYGIIPGQTPLNEALTLLEQHGFTAQQENTLYNEMRYLLVTDSCHFRIAARTDTGNVFAITAFAWRDLYLGDFISIFGSPLIWVVTVEDPCAGSVTTTTLRGFSTVDFYPVYAVPIAVESSINGFSTAADTRSGEPLWDDFQPYGHFGRAAHRSPRRCGG
jgi:hypothetical protein